MIINVYFRRSDCSPLDAQTHPIVHTRYPCVRSGPSLEGVRGQEAAKDGVERGLE
jgi:hypothetical protein